MATYIVYPAGGPDLTKVTTDIKPVTDATNNLGDATHTWAKVSGQIFTSWNSAGYGFNGNGGASQGLYTSGSNTFLAAAGAGSKIGLNDNSGKNFIEAKQAGITKLGDDGSGNGPSITMGTGSPAGVVTAVVGSIYLRTDGAANTTLYVKESGTGTAGWTAK